MGKNIPALKRGFSYDPVAGSLGVYVDGVHVENFSASTTPRYYVDQHTGNDSNGGRSWDDAFLTYQAGVTAATVAANAYEDVTLYIGPGEYDEQIVVPCSTTACQASSGDTWLGYKIGRFMIVHLGKAVVIKNSTLDSSHTLDILRMKTEIYGGTFRNYTDSGDFAAIHFERSNTGNYGDVINAKVVGAKIEGRSSAQIGIDCDAAQYVWIEDCWLSGFDTGILIAGNSLGSCVETVVKNCYFRANTNDILMGASQFTVVEDCKFIDDTATKYISNSDFSGRGGTPTDLVCFGGVCNEANLTKFDATNLYVCGMATGYTTSAGNTTPLQSKGGTS